MAKINSFLLEAESVRPTEAAFPFFRVLSDVEPRFGVMV